MTTHLKPCPFCGGGAETVSPASGGSPYAMCTVNFCTAPKATEAEAAAAWNRRAEAPVLLVEARVREGIASWHDSEAERILKRLGDVAGVHFHRSAAESIRAMAGEEA